MTTWKKFLSVAAVAAVVGLALAWGVYGDASLGKGSFRDAFSPISPVVTVTGE